MCARRTKVRDRSASVKAGTDRGESTFTQVCIFGRLAGLGPSQRPSTGERGDCQRMLLGLGRVPVPVQAISPSSKVRYCLSLSPMLMHLWKQARFEKQSTVYRARIGCRDSSLGSTRQSVRVVFLPETRGKPRDEPALCSELWNPLTQQTPGIADLDQNRSTVWRSSFISPPAHDEK